MKKNADIQYCRRLKIADGGQFSVDFVNTKKNYENGAFMTFTFPKNF